MKLWLTFSSDKRISLSSKHIDFLRGKVEMLKASSARKNLIPECYNTLCFSILAP